MRTYYETTIDENEKEKIIDEFTTMIYNNQNRESVRSYIEILMTSLLGGFNSYRSLDEFLNNNMGERWKDACQAIWDSGNYGWTMAVKELLINMENEIKDKTGT